jgi:UDP-2,3-diacylglucosamine hydrolase
MTTLFISDLHLCTERPHINVLFSRFLDEVAHDAASLYILGDLFEYWVGDDQLDHDPLARQVASQLANAARRGSSVYFMHGNRDFLIGERFAKAANCTLLKDPSPLALGDQRLLLLHGDTLCTDDLSYQQFRAQVRDPQWQADWLAKPYPERAELARTIRSRSNVEKSMKADAIMDVSSTAVAAAFEEHGCPVMIHGHTHRPAKHQLKVSGKACTRWVLQDWYDQGGYLSSGPHDALAAHSIGAAAMP